LQRDTIVKTSGTKKIAERYVRALFDVASASSTLPQVEQDLRSLGGVIAAQADVRDFLHNPLLTRGAQETIAAALLSHMKAHELTMKFIALLARSKRLDVLPAIIAAFLELAAATRGELSAKVVSAAVLSDAQVGDIAKALGSVFNKKINLATREDASLIGGVVITVGSQQLDGSVAGKLQRLKSSLKVA
jgi:F-type H+-transporting ATPase subunit delta